MNFRAQKIEEKNPLKQGLKHETAVFAIFVHPIEEKNPLKQGLKHQVKNETKKLLKLKRRIH